MVITSTVLCLTFTAFWGKNIIFFRAYKIKLRRELNTLLGDYSCLLFEFELNHSILCKYGSVEPKNCSSCLPVVRYCSVLLTWQAIWRICHHANYIQTNLHSGTRKLKILENIESPNTFFAKNFSESLREPLSWRDQCMFAKSIVSPKKFEILNDSSVKLCSKRVKILSKYFWKREFDIFFTEYEYKVSWNLKITKTFLQFFESPPFSGGKRQNGTRIPKDRSTILCQHSEHPIRFLVNW